jgi:hypothetical protein
MNTITSHANARLAGALVALTALTAVTILTDLTGAGAAHAETPPPGLSIAIDNGAEQTRPNTDVSYRITLANDGTGPVTAVVVVTVPLFASIEKAGDGTVHGVDATWKVTVDPGQKKIVSTSAHIGRIPEDQYRVTTLASVYLGDTVAGAPLIRSADTDKIPGVTDPVVVASSPKPHPAPTTAHSEGAVLAWVLWTAIGGAIGLLVVGALIIIVRTTRRRRRASHPDSPGQATTSLPTSR